MGSAPTGCGSSRAGSTSPRSIRTGSRASRSSPFPEGFGRVIIEAQAMGRPVVATDHGGARETIVPGATGWLAPPRDPAALAAAIGQALRLDPAERAAFARRAMAQVTANYTR